MGDDFDIFNEIGPISDSEIRRNGKIEKEFKDLGLSTSINHIYSKYDKLLDVIHAPIRDEVEEEEENLEDEREEKEEQTQQNEDDHICFKINRPPPNQEKKMTIKMRKDQNFGSIIDPLQQKFNKRVTLSFDGERISNNCTPQQLIDEFDAEDGDQIDTNYGADL